MSDKATELVETLYLARGFNEPHSVNAEYARGQAELICDMFNISTDHKDLVITLITGTAPIS